MALRRSRASTRFLASRLPPHVSSPHRSGRAAGRPATRRCSARPRSDRLWASRRSAGLAGSAAACRWASCRRLSAAAGLAVAGCPLPAQSRTSFRVTVTLARASPAPAMPPARPSPARRPWGSLRRWPSVPRLTLRRSSTKCWQGRRASLSDVCRPASLTQCDTTLVEGFTRLFRTIRTGMKRREFRMRLNSEFLRAFSCHGLRPRE
mmetsp:Transcript_34580/g.86272  ORF Transcript_34580/g.86272 Transcript_34580/m.86272 type:complete len:207 (+) Transcript_34580:1042-1662(+)